MRTSILPMRSLSWLLKDTLGAFLPNRFANNNPLTTSPWMQEGDKFMLSIPVPGLRKEDLSVYMEGRTLVVSTTRQHTPINPVSAIGRQLRHAFVFPEGIDTNRVQATCRNGLLTIELNKKKSMRRSIVVKVQGASEQTRNAWLRGWWKKIKSAVKLHNTERTNR